LSSFLVEHSSPWTALLPFSLFGDWKFHRWNHEHSLQFGNASPHFHKNQVPLGSSIKKLYFSILWWKPEKLCLPQLLE
jgi:hypothetical protein